MEMSWLMPVIEFLGGLVVVWFGAEKIGSVLQVPFARWPGGGISRQSKIPWRGVLAGGMWSTFIQSSTATTTMLMGYVGGELMTLTQAAAVILGAELGSIVVVWVAILPVTFLSPWLLVLGFLLLILGRLPWVKRFGHLLIGFGLFYLGMTIMAIAAEEWVHFPPLISALGWLANPLLALALGALLAGVLQSSALAMVTVLVPVGQGLIPIAGGITLGLGILLGVCGNAMIDSVGKPPAIIRVGVLHLLFKVGGVLLVIGGVPWLAALVLWIPGLPIGLSTQTHWLAGAALQEVALAFGLISVLMTSLFYPVIPTLVKWSQVLVPEQPMQWEEWGEEVAVAHPLEETYQPQYLDVDFLAQPSLALEMARREAGFLVEILEGMIEQAPLAIGTGDLQKMTRLRDQDDQVDAIHHAISHYLSRVDKHQLTPVLNDHLLAAVTVIGEMETIGDIVENNLYHLAVVCSESKIRMTEAEWDNLNRYHLVVLNALRSANSAFLSDDPEAANRVMHLKDEISGMDADFRAAKIRELQSGGGITMASYALQLDLRENLKRIYYHAKRIAKLVARVDDAASWSVATINAEDH